MPAALFVGGPFHGELMHVARYEGQLVREMGSVAFYAPFTMRSQRRVLRCMVVADLAERPVARLKLTLDAMMRNVPITELASSLEVVT